MGDRNCRSCSQERFHNRVVEHRCIAKKRAEVIKVWKERVGNTAAKEKSGTADAAQRLEEGGGINKRPKALSRTE